MENTFSHTHTHTYIYIYIYIYIYKLFVERSNKNIAFKYISICFDIYTHAHRKSHLLHNFLSFETKNDSTRSERQLNTPKSYPKRANDKRHPCSPLETPASYEKN